jgi:hypothetical protein
MKPRKTKNVGGDWKDDAQRKPGKQNVAGGKQLDCDAREMIATRTNLQARIAETASL